jgi:hypothetical protein
VLVNGKKVDPVPFETALNAAPLSTGIHESLVFGVNRAYIGVMIIPSASTNDVEEEVRTQAWSIVDSVNATVSGHARIPSKDMILVLPRDSTFSKSSKGTVQRPLVYRHFEAAISTNYDQFETGTSDLNKVTLASIEDAQEYVLRVVREIGSGSKAARGKPAVVNLDTDLFSYGVDSLQSARIRNRLQAELELSGQELSSNIVYECATVRRLASAVYSKISGSAQDGNTQEDELAFMWELVRKYSVSESPASASANGHHNASRRVLVRLFSYLVMSMWLIRLLFRSLLESLALSVPIFWTKLCTIRSRTSRRSYACAERRTTSRLTSVYKPVSPRDASRPYLRRQRRRLHAWPPA